MSINSIKHLNDKKKKLALFFTGAIFLVIMTIEISFLGYKYYNYNRQEFLKLEGFMSNIKKDYSKNEFFRSFFCKGKCHSNNQVDNYISTSGPKRISNNDVIVYKTGTNEILFSSLNDAYLLGKVIGSCNNCNKGKIVKINGIEYYVLNSNLNNKTSVILFLESKLTKNDIIIGLLQYLIFIIILSFLVYFLGYRFIGYILKPVEENMKDMEQFVYNAGHELKTPLSVIKSSLQLAALRKDYSESIDDSIKELDKMNLLIESLISLSVLDINGEKTSINVNEIINSTISDYKRKIDEKNIELKIIENGKSVIQSNPEYFKILFSNILSNAIKYNKNGGKIEITINKGSISIKDTGVGIKQESLPKVYDRFFQDTEARNGDGFGIGLSLVKKIVDLYNWKIKIESELSLGTVITIYF